MRSVIKIITIAYLAALAVGMPEPVPSNTRLEARQGGTGVPTPDCDCASYEVCCGDKKCYDATYGCG